MPARPTIADVASRSGVSTATVSRVLSGATSSRPTTRARVLAAAKELDYKPSAVARALKVQATRTIGLLIADIQNPFFPQLVSAVEAEAVDRGYGLVLCNPSDDPARELAALDLLIERRVDGIMVASSRAMRRHASLLREIGVPVVLLNSGRVEGLPSIDTAQRRGARLGAEHLLELGHRRIGHISAPRTNAAAADRLAGARDAVRAFGEDAELFVADGDSHVEGGAAAATRLVTIARCTGIVCYNDLTAIGALRGVRSAGLRVPEEVSIVGFDDIDLAAWIDPPLTTVRQPTEAMGRWAVERLVAPRHRRGADRADERASRARARRSRLDRAGHGLIEGRLLRLDGGRLREVAVVDLVLGLLDRHAVAAESGAGDRGERQVELRRAERALLDLEVARPDIGDLPDLLAVAAEDVRPDLRRRHVRGLHRYQSPLWAYVGVRSAARRVPARSGHRER